MSNQYPNPTIAEAICDIRFRMPYGNVWPPRAFPELFKQIRNNYPKMEPLIEMDLQLDAGPLRPNTRTPSQRAFVRFTHKTRPLILQWGENMLTVNMLAPYQGWHVMHDDVLAAWRLVEEVLQPEAITRVGLRYINSIEKETDQDRPGDWLVATDYISRGILRSAPGFLSRMETHLDLENVLIVTLGDMRSALEGSRYGSVIFDIDRLVEQELLPKQEVLAGAIDCLHTDVWKVFSAARSEKLDTLLHRKQSNISANGANNATAVHESLAPYSISPSTQYPTGIQSFSATPQGHLLQSTLLRVLRDNPQVITQDELDRATYEERMRKNKAAIELLRSWYEEDAQEQRETWEILKEALDIEDDDSPAVPLDESSKTELAPEEERMRKNLAAIELLRSWCEEGDEQKQQETWKFLKQALGEDRHSDRKLSP